MQAALCEMFGILGVVSGGRGKLRSCGGVNNPTHITRQDIRS